MKKNKKCKQIPAFPLRELIQNGTSVKLTEKRIIVFFRGWSEEFKNHAALIGGSFYKGLWLFKPSQYMDVVEMMDNLFGTHYNDLIFPPEENI